MYQSTTMDILYRLQQLIDHILLMQVIQNLCPYNRMKICLYKFKNNVDISVVLGFNVSLLMDNVIVLNLFKKDNFSKGPLGISWVVKGIVDFLNCDNFMSFTIDCFPNDTIRPFRDPLNYLVLLQH